MCLVLGGIVPIIDRAEAFAGSNGYIAFDNGGEIFVMDATGADVTNVTQDPAGDTHPSFSPDGTELSFVRNSAGQFDIWKIPSGGGTPTQLTNHLAFEADATFSGLGDEVAFVRDLGGQQFDILAVSADGTFSYRAITSDTGADEQFPSWSPDGTRIVYSHTPTGLDTEIAIVAADGSTPTSPTFVTANSTGEGFPVWSPDGNSLMYVGNAGGDYELIWATETEPGVWSETTLTDNAVNDYLPDFSPDGSRIVWTQGDGTAAEILVADLVTSPTPAISNVVQLTTNTAADSSPDWGTFIPSDAPLPGEPDTVTTDAASGETVTTDGAGDGATPDDVVETYVTHPDGGTISISEDVPTQELEGRYEAFGEQVSITAPVASGADPILIEFRFDASIVADRGLDEIEIFRNGILVEHCKDGPGTFYPDPCLSGRSLLADGDALFSVLTSAASEWNAGLRAPRQIGGGGGGGGGVPPPSPSPSDTATPEVTITAEATPEATLSPSATPETVVTTTAPAESPTEEPSEPAQDPPADTVAPRGEGGADVDAISPNGDGVRDVLSVTASFDEPVTWRFTIVPAGQTHSPEGTVYATTGQGTQATVRWPDPAGPMVAEGSYRWELGGSDAAGNEMTPLVGTLTVDISAPEIDRLLVSPRRLRPGGKAKITVGITEPAKVRVRVVRNGRVVARLVSRNVDEPGELATAWRIRRSVAPGRYIVKAKVVDPAGNRSAKRKTIRVLRRR